jgi:hypothetical protein
MHPAGPNLLPPWLTGLWLAALAAVLVLHCGHFARNSGQHRWFHASHVLMLASMLYMYASMEFRWRWLPAAWQASVFAATSLAIGGWLAVRIATARPVSGLWLLALVMQAAMAYMWLPDWFAPLTWLLVAYHTVEAAAWLAGRLDDRGGRGCLGPGEPASVVALGGHGWRPRAGMAVMAASMAWMFAAMQLMR